MATKKTVQQGRRSGKNHDRSRRKRSEDRPITAELHRAAERAGIETVESLRAKRARKMGGAL